MTTPRPLKRTNISDDTRASDILLRAQRRPRTVYSSQKRSHLQVPAVTQVSSSPLKDVGQEDITLKEMSRRMKKRSRSGLQQKGRLDLDKDAMELETESRPVKKPKRMSNSSNIHGPTALRSSLNISVSEMNASTLTTPHPRTRSDQAMNDASLPPAHRQSTMSRDFSPLPPARHVFTRTTSLALKENARIPGLPAQLASPFHSRTSTTTSPPKRAGKTPFRTKLGRTRSACLVRRKSVNDRRVSLSAFHRHPSGSHALQQKSHQDWLVPAQTTPTFLKNSHIHFDFDPTHAYASFPVSPLACSTPVPRSVLPAACYVNLDPAPGFATSSASNPPNDKTVDITMADATPRPGNASSLDTSDSLFPRLCSPVGRSVSALIVPTPTPPRRRTLVHLSQDSIFSSGFDFSTSMTVKQPLQAPHSAATRKDTEQPMHASPPAVAPPSSPTIPKSPSSDGDELRNLFGVLGLDGSYAELLLGLGLTFGIRAEDEVWNSHISVIGPQHNAPSRDDVGESSVRATNRPIQRRKSSIGKRLKHNITGKPSRNGAPRTRANKAKSLSAGPTRRPSIRSTRHSSSSHPALLVGSQSCPLPTIRMKIHDVPLAPASDGEDDELLLTSRGWDWDPSDSR